MVAGDIHQSTIAGDESVGEPHRQPDQPVHLRRRPRHPAVHSRLQPDAARLYAHHQLHGGGRHGPHLRHRRFRAAVRPRHVALECSGNRPFQFGRLGGRQSRQGAVEGRGQRPRRLAAGVGNRLGIGGGIRLHPHQRRLSHQHSRHRPRRPEPPPCAHLQPRQQRKPAQQAAVGQSRRHRRRSSDRRAGRPGPGAAGWKRAPVAAGGGGPHHRGRRTGARRRRLQRQIWRRKRQVATVGLRQPAHSGDEPAAEPDGQPNQPFDLRGALGRCQHRARCTGHLPTVRPVQPRIASATHRNGCGRRHLDLCSPFGPPRRRVLRRLRGIGFGTAVRQPARRRAGSDRHRLPSHGRSAVQRCRPCEDRGGADRFRRAWAYRRRAGNLRAHRPRIFGCLQPSAGRRPVRQLSASGTARPTKQLRWLGGWLRLEILSRAHGGTMGFRLGNALQPGMDLQPNQ